MVQVAAAAIYGPDGRLLISRRQDHLHQGGLLEFPGGKVDPGETVCQALVRELEEELGITAVAFEPLIRIRHDYPDKRVLLDVWKVTSFQGQPHGREGQALYWLTEDQLLPEQFPAANRPIITALTLPQHYLITGTAADTLQWFARLDRALSGGIELVQLRANRLDDDAYRALAIEVAERCRVAGARLLLNRDPWQVLDLSVDGLHLNRHQLERVASDRVLSEQLLAWRSEGEGRLLGGSCHNQAELLQAQQLGVDYMLISPVQSTGSHPNEPTLGWSGFAVLVENATMPAYALGGLKAADAELAIAQGGQGIAAIGAWWNSALAD
ncbi:MAG: Nudix family hydrolase [Motiliproteus sp.]